MRQGRCEECRYPPLQPVIGPPWQPAADETDVAAFAGHFQLDPDREFMRLRQHGRRHERVVERLRSGC